MFGKKIVSTHFLTTLLGTTIASALSQSDYFYPSAFEIDLLFVRRRLCVSDQAFRPIALLRLICYVLAFGVRSRRVPSPIASAVVRN